MDAQTIQLVGALVMLLMGFLTWRWVTQARSVVVDRRRRSADALGPVPAQGRAEVPFVVERGGRRHRFELGFVCRPAPQLPEAHLSVRLALMGPRGVLEVQESGVALRSEGDEIVGEHRFEATLPDAGDHALVLMPDHPCEEIDVVIRRV